MRSLAVLLDRPASTAVDHAQPLPRGERRAADMYFAILDHPGHVGDRIFHLAVVAPGGSFADEVRGSGDHDIFSRASPRYFSAARMPAALAPSAVDQRFLSSVPKRRTL